MSADLIPLGTRAKWGTRSVTVEAVSYREGQRIYLARTDDGTVIYAPDGDLVVEEAKT